MPTLEDVNEFMFENFDKVSTSRGGTHFHARCALCGDSKKSSAKKRFHLQFHSEDHIEFNCFNCGQSGGFYKLYSYLKGCSEKEAYKLYNAYDKNRLLNKLNKKKSTSTKTVIPKKETFNYILKDCISLDDTPNGYIQNVYHSKLKEFVNSRKVKQKVYVAYQGEYKNRIIIPVFEGEDIVYFQGRAISSETEPKYLNPSVYKSNIILNKNNFNYDKYICITEGILDADSIGSQGTSILGKELDRKFLDSVSKYTNKGMILVMDNDNDGIKNLYSFLDMYRDKLSYFVMPKKYNSFKDLNELLVHDKINTDEVYEFVVNNSYSSLKAKLKLVEKGVIYETK